MKTIKKYLVSIVILNLIISCQSSSSLIGYEAVRQSDSYPLIQFIVEEGNQQTFETYKEFSQVAEYAKFPITKTDVKHFNLNQDIPPTIRVLGIESTFGFTNTSIDSLLSFVAKGGTLFMTNANWDERAAFLMGLKPNYKMDIDDENNGWYFKETVLPGLKGHQYAGRKHKGLKASNFSENINVLISAISDKSYPVLLENKIGRGKVILKNSIIPIDKFLRGIVFSQLLNGIEGVPYPIVNAVSIQLDDFPSPLYQIYKEPVKSSMNITIAKYVTDVWWPDMKKLAKELDLKYTVYTAFDYANKIAPPFTFEEWDRNTFEKNGYSQEMSSWLGREVLKDGHELGFHGYNHVSLMASYWKNPDYIVPALKAAEKKWKTANFKTLPVSYVPPSNEIDSIGLAKLAEGMPSLKYIQSIYVGELANGGDREFGPDPYNVHFFDFPRITSGYIISEKKKVLLNSLFLNTGIWSHFVHPDDVFQIPDGSNSHTGGNYELRNAEELNWHSSNGKKGLLDVFKDEIKAFKKTYPLTKFYTAKQATEKTIEWYYASFKHVRQEGLYVVESDTFNSENNQDQYWFVYVSNEHEELIHRELNELASDIRKTDLLHGTLFSFKTKDALLALTDLTKLQNYDETELINEVKKNYELFAALRLKLAPLMDKIAHYVSEGNLKMATTAMEDYVKDGNQLLISQWKEYATYMVWQDRGEEVWNILEKEYVKMPIKSNADLSRIIQKIASYPSNDVRKTWLNRQISWNTEDVEVLKEYLEYFNTGEKDHVVLIVYRDLVRLNPSVANKKTLITYLLNTKNTEIFEVLNQIAICDPAYKDMATTIAWAYADDLNYDKALLWKDCSNEIDGETIQFWLVNSKKFEELKDVDFPKYIGILLINKPKKALEELQNIRICKDNLKPLAAKIAKLFGDYEEYKAAVLWAECAENLLVSDLLTWQYETQNYARMKKTYSSYISDNPEDNATKFHMGKLLMYNGDLFSVAEVAHSMHSGIEFSELRGLLNKNVSFLEKEDKRQLVAQYPALFSDKIKNAITEEIRLEKGNDIIFEVTSTNDRLDPTALDFKGGYSLYDKKRNTHSISAVKGFVYPVGFIEENATNAKRDLIGLEYRFDIAQNDKKNLFLKARIEGSNDNETYYHLGGGVNINRDKNFYSLEATYKPVQTGPGYVLNIYQGQLAGYSELALSKRFKQVLSFEGNYYTDSEMEATLMARTSFSLVDENSTWNMSPLIEAAYTLATADRRTGFPYWVANNRLYGGGGMAFTIGKEKDKFYFNGSASIFQENSNSSFERYMGSMQIRIKKHTLFSMGFEIYTIENFYSNGFNLGLRYNL